VLKTNTTGSYSDKL